MNRFKKIIALGALLVAGANAEGMGVGYDHSLAGVQGISLNYTSGNMLYQLIVDLEANSTTAIAIAPRAFYQLIESGPLLAYVGLGIDYSTCKGGDYTYLNNCYVAPAVVVPGVAEPKAPLAIEIPMRLDLKIHPMLSIHTGFGIKYGLAKDVDTNKGFKGDVVGNAGLTLWFNAGGSAPAKKSKKVKAVEPEEAPAPAPVATEDEEEEE
jgi:hypothetical protein